jgi:DNA-binding MarR family transcriptional regulator
MVEVDVVTEATNQDGRNPLPPWTLLTSHGLALLYVATHADATGREIAAHLELTERRVAAIIRDLSEANLVVVSRIGRRNHYSLNSNAHFRHPLVADVPFDAFIRLWTETRHTPE